MQALSSTKRVRHKPTAIQGVMFSLTARGKKVFEVRYTDPATGKQRYEKVGSFAQAKARLREVQHTTTKGEIVGDPTVTVGELAEKWRGLRKVKPRTVRNYDNSYRCHVEKRWARVRARDVQRVGIVEWLSGLRRLDGKPLDEDTKGIALSVLTNILDVGVEMNVIASNPCRSLPRRSKPHPTRIEPRILQDGELARLTDAAPAWLGDVILVTYYAALRLGEVCGLQWQDVDFDRNVLVIQRQLSPDMAWGTPKGGKTAEVPMVPELRRLLAEKKLAAGAAATSPVLPGMRCGGYMSPRSVGRSFEVAREKAGLSKEPRVLRFHDLRHSAISRLANAPGAVLPQVQAFARHATLVTTMTYIHRIESATWAEEAAAALAGL